MNRSTFDVSLDWLFRDRLEQQSGVYLAAMPGKSVDESHTSSVFSEKWANLAQDSGDTENWKSFQFEWYLKCYGYKSQDELGLALGSRRVILDAGCGPGYKAAWFARLNPDALIIAMDLSESVFLAAQRYAGISNMRFVRGDIAATPFRDSVINLISCDQVLHHTDDPPATLREFSRILAPSGQLNTYVYARKALPRELLDEHLREFSKQLTTEQLWALSSELTTLGRTLSDLDIDIAVPDMPVLGIRGGNYDLQRFVYWNFLKCFWNEQHGFEASKMINFDWYSPSTAFRYSLEEFVAMTAAAGFSHEFLHSEEACHTGRFHK